MCGIAVIIKKNSDKEVSGLLLKQMINKMQHRGPDSSGCLFSKGIGMGMVRLAIVDPNTGNQPIWNEDQSVCVVCNGEIYNHKQLREKLSQTHHHFQTETDIEVIVHLYEEYGEDFVKHLEGIFAIALWDQNKGTLMLARDRIGVKPLFYLEQEDQFVFSSELKSLVTHEENLDIDIQGLSDYHSYRFVPADRTIISKIKKVPASHIVFINNGVLTMKSYWHVQNLVNSNHNNDRLLKLLVDAVKSQMAPGVQSGLFLSGGLDSSILLALQSKLYQSIPITFTVGFEKPNQKANISEYDEIVQASNISRYYQAKHISESYSAQEVLELLPQIIRDLDEPIADPTSIPLWFVSRLAKQSGCKVVYSGEGLDEIFYGYAVYNQAKWLEMLQKLPVSLRQSALQLLTKWRLAGVGVLSRSLNPLEEWYQGVGGIFTAAEKLNLFKKEITKVLPPAQMSFGDEQNKAHTKNSIMDRMARLDFHNWLPENTLAKSDKISMSHSLELRVPFLDQHIVEYAFQISKDEKRRGKIGKIALREALKHEIPMEIIQRPKVGFPVPISAWIFGEWFDYVSAKLLDPHARTCNLYKRAEIERLLAAPTPQRERAGRLLWSILTFELWLQIHPNVRLA